MGMNRKLGRMLSAHATKIYLVFLPAGFVNQQSTMGRRSNSNVQQRRKLTREPLYPLYDDVDNQPRTSGLATLNPAQRSRKNEMAHRDFATRRILTTTAMLRKRASRKHQDGEDDRVYTEVLMNLDEGPDEQSEVEGPHIQPGDQWEDEEEEEELLYFRAKGAIQNLYVSLYAFFLLTSLTWVSVNLGITELESRRPW